MSLFMNNRLIVSKQYHRVFQFSKYCITSILFRGLQITQSSMVAGGLPVQS